MGRLASVFQMEVFATAVCSRMAIDAGRAKINIATFAWIARLPSEQSWLCGQPRGWHRNARCILPFMDKSRLCRFPHMLESQEIISLIN